MNRLAITLVLSTLAFAASAQSAATDPAVRVEADSSQVTVVSGTEATNDRHCLRETGSHVVSKDQKSCVSANGSSYTKEDIDRTGTTDLADALRRLDPSVHVSHH
jgi:hypothetical protein